jgi:MFS superfamily sulfate permease-like transporter
MNTFEHAGDLKAKEFAPFLIMYLILMSLKKIFPGKPWIIFIALVGMIYGFITSVFFKEIVPVLLKDKYPAMMHPKIYHFDYIENKNKIPIEAIIIGSAKVGFVAVLETLISARIADNLTGTRFD